MIGGGQGRITMAGRCGLLLLTGLLIGAGPRQEAVQLAPVPNLDGEWRPVRHERDGKFVPEDLRYRTTIYADRMLTIPLGEAGFGPFNCRLVFPTDSHPAAVNIITIGEEGQAIDVNRAIFLLEGRRLKIFWGTLGPQSVRPKHFTTTEPGRAATVLERIGR
jgi:uncharacterized protein (TIGR03067 family)